MIPAVITDTSITFFAKGRPWNLAADHPKFADVKALLQFGYDDVDAVIQLTDVRIAVDVATAGQAVLTEDALLFNGKAMPEAWREKAAAAPDSMKVLLVYPGDRVRVEGDEDAKDGIYIVGDVDNTDAEKRVMVEAEDGEGYFGYVSNASVKEIVEEGPRLPAQEPEPQPIYEAEDIGCDCNEAGMDSEWNWEPDQNAYVCNGCGEVQ